MKVAIISVLLFVSINFGVWAQDIPFTVDNIPEGLKKNAYVIKRLEEINLEVLDISHTKYSSRTISTILNEKGDDALSFIQYTSKLNRLEDVEIKIYDAKGKLTEKFKKKDLTRQSPFGDNLVDDYMANFLTITPPSYPLTIEISYSETFEGSFIYPRYNIISPGEALEKSSYTVKVSSETGLRYKEQKIKLAPQITSDGKFKVYKWSVNNLPAFEYEEGSISGSDAYPSIILAPEHFSVYEKKGGMSSWKAFGEWIYELLNGLDDLSPDKKAFYNSLVKDARSEKEKVAIVYQYLQKNYRYISIQLGIGGYKPFSANFTESKKYGDCKGLSFYTHAVLKSIGINSYVALINAGYNLAPADPAFPCNTFNHMILCVPQAKDTIWLECTSNKAQFGVLGGFTENRNALLITPAGGVLTPTPKSRYSDNLSYASTIVTMNADGSGNSVTSLNSAGSFKETMHEILESKKDDQKDFFIHTMGFKQPDEFQLSMPVAGDETFTKLALNIERIPEFTAGSKMFLNPRIYTFYNKILPKAEGRKQDFFFYAPFDRSDTTIFVLPSGFKNEALPKNKEGKCAYADYLFKYWYDQEKNHVVCVAHLTLQQHRIPADKYAEVKKFFDEVYAENSQKIVITKADN